MASRPPFAAAMASWFTRPSQPPRSEDHPPATGPHHGLAAHGQGEEGTAKIGGDDLVELIHLHGVRRSDDAGTTRWATMDTALG